MSLVLHWIAEVSGTCLVGDHLSGSDYNYMSHAIHLPASIDRVLS